jgi:putative membrane protein insertion efficiency factor
LNLLQHILILTVRIYRLTISPAQLFLFGPGTGCRFTPSCSAYALTAVEKRGALAGSWLAAKRVCRCHPWGGCGHDPVPDAPLPTANSQLPIFNHGS